MGKRYDPGTPCLYGHIGRDTRGKCRQCQQERVWERKLRNAYGITRVEHQALLEAQDGRCAICGATQGNDAGWALHIDHDHQTGKVRGLLCHSCNVGLGHFGDRLDLLERAIQYLKKPSRKVLTAGSHTKGRNL